VKFLRNTKDHTKWWINREIDWNKDYLQTWNHPHRKVLSDILGRWNWGSLVEIGCASGPNLVRFAKDHPNKQIGGIDVNPDAIALARQALKGAYLNVSSVEDIMMSDDSTDIVLTDMALIYVNNPHKAMKEIKRIARNYVVFCELHTKSLWARLKLKWSSGYNAHNYHKLLTQYGYEQITAIKITEDMWPGGNPQKDYGYIYLAKVPKRK